MLDERDGTPVAGAVVVLRGPLRHGSAGADASWPPRRATTAADGRYAFLDLPVGRYGVSIQRLGYAALSLEVTLAPDEPLFLSLLLEPVPFRLDPLALRGLRGSGPSLVEPRDGRVEPGGRAEAIRARQQRFLAGDVRQLGRADLREANTVMEEDVFRAFQRMPGVAWRDDFTADLWTRGAAAGQTVVTLDGVPMPAPLHALGVLSGPAPDMLSAATLHPGVMEASSQGGGAAVIELESRSPATGPPSRGAALSPVSARFTLDGRPTDGSAWAGGGRRSHLDLLSRLTPGIGPGRNALGYAFGDLTGRVDLLLPGRARLEASAYLQDDRVFGDVAGLAPGNEGAWGTRLARASLVAAVGPTEARLLAGLSRFDASVAARASAAVTPAHPATENHYAAAVWEARVGSPPGVAEPWSVGLRALREDLRYDGPDADFALLLTPDELARRGITDPSPLLLGVEHGRLTTAERATRLALWGERRERIGRSLEVGAGLRVEGGDRVGDSEIRLAPRVLVRHRSPGSPVALSAAYGRAYQYTRPVARTDVIRPGLRVSEVLAQADGDTPALRSDVVTVGVEAWRGSDWLVGATAWARWTDGLLLPEPTPGPREGPRPLVHGSGAARGLDVSVRRVEGAVRGFASYGLGRSRQEAGGLEFAASEDRTHVATLGVMADAAEGWRLGGTLRAESGAPFTRLTVVSTACDPGGECEEAPIYVGTPAGQRGAAFVSLDLMAEWTRRGEDWSVSVYGQVRNALGSANAVTYRASCLCVGDGPEAGGWLGDRFERGLPRLPVLGLRARF